MQEAIPYKIWVPNPQHPFQNRSALVNKDIGSDSGSTKGGGGAGGGDDIKNMVLENAVIVLGRRGCCMSHVVKRLLQGLGVNPAVHEVDEDDETSVFRQLEGIVGQAGGRMQFPAVFIGGQLFGGLDRIMATHITGELIPVLKQAGALWL
ncbi:hypothetical protein ACSBR1_027942 [Camellia fascicularis]